MLSGGLPILRDERIDSTQLEARRLLESGDQPPPFAVVAREQFAGRGRQGREWASPSGGLWVTSAWRLASAAEPALGVRLGLAALTAIGAELPVEMRSRLRLKWPNDIVIDGGKVAGVLAETLPAVDGGRVLLAGVGVNANVERRSLPATVRRDAAILSELLEAEIDLAALLMALLERQRAAVEAPEATMAVVARAEALLHRRGERVTLVRADGEAVAGLLAGLTERGEPVLLDESGSALPGPFTGFAQRPAVAASCNT